MSTPEQLTLIRHVIHHRELRYADKERELTDALIAVLRDAERFAALERAFSRHNDEGMITVMRWKGQRIWHYTKEPDIDGLTIAELADRLREGGQK